MAKPLTSLIAAAFSPMHQDGSLNLDLVGPMVDRLHADGLAGVYVAGSTGEGVSLTLAERSLLTEAFAQATAGRMKLIVQVGHNCTADAQQLAAHAQRVGADAVSAISPSYFRPTTLSALVACMREIAAAAPKLPFYYYHIPAMNGATLDMVHFLEQGAQRIPTLRGIKYASTDVPAYQACLNCENRGFDVLWGCDEMLLSALAVGAKEAVGSTYNFAGHLCRRIIWAFETGDLVTARCAQALHVQMVRCLQRFPVFPALKATMKLSGFDCGPSRLPLQPLTEAEVAELKAGLESIGFFSWSQPPDPGSEENALDRFLKYHRHTPQHRPRAVRSCNETVPRN